MRVLVVMVMLMFVFVRVLVFVIMFMLVSVVVGTHLGRSFSRQSTSAIFAHYSISKEANSISRPARRSPLGLWQAGHSPKKSSDWNSFEQAVHQKRAGTCSIS